MAIALLLIISTKAISQNQTFLARADSLYNRGLEEMSTGGYESAISLFKEAAEICDKTLGKGEHEYACSNNSIGSCYYYLGDYDKALEYYRESLSIIEKVYGKNHPDNAVILYNIGLCFSILGDYAKALEYHQQCLAVREKAFGRDHPDYASSLSSIADCYHNLGDYAKVLEYYHQILAINEEVLGKADYASNLYSIGSCYLYLGDYPKALECYNQSLTIREKVLGEDHPDYASSLSGIGECYLYLGDYPKALEYYQQSLIIREKALGNEDPYYASSLHNIGDCYWYLGDYPKALGYYQQSLTIREKVLGKDDPAYASSLNNIGICYADLGDYPKALEYYQQSLTIREKALGKDDPDYASSLNNIGICYSELGDYPKALEYYQQSLAIYEESLGKSHPAYASSLNNIGICYFDLGDYPKALEYYQQSLTINEKVLGKDHPDYAASLIGIGLSNYYLGNNDKATESFVQFTNTVASVVTGTFTSLTESQRESFWKKYSDFFNNHLFRYSVELSSPQMKQTAYDGVLFGKGLLLNAEMELNRLILESGDKEALDKFNQIRASRIRLDKIYQDPVGRKAQIDSLNNDINVRQQDLMKHNKAYGDYTRNLAVKWTDVLASLDKKAIAIEFGTYSYQGVTFYIALTLKKGYTEPHLVELFNSEELARVKPSQYYMSTILTDLVWGSLEGELKGVKNVYFSPAGELSNIAIEYLPDNDGKHLVCDNRNFYRLTSTREITRRYQTEKINNVAVYGGIRYDISPDSRLTGEESESEILAHAASRPFVSLDSLNVSRGSSGGNIIWKYLAGSKEEAESISMILTTGKISNYLYIGANGTEESFKSMSGTKKGVIHIATHGFYWTKNEVARNGVEKLSFMTERQNLVPQEDKMLTRSGLLFAGAQNAFDGKDIPLDVEDGVLTAKEISRMDLRNTDLVVISACQSGLGEVTGDGVFGLQRGFKKAGTQSLLMSLWKVNDDATKIMMTRFYENLTMGQSKLDAFHEAQTYLRKYDKGRYDKPIFYAAFVLLDAIR